MNTPLAETRDEFRVLIDAEVATTDQTESGFTWMTLPVSVGNEASGISTAKALRENGNYRNVRLQKRTLELVLGEWVEL